MHKFQLLWILIYILFNSCVEPYNIKFNGTQEVLVVEGFISNETKQHEVVISKTSPITKAQVIPETGAQVFIKDGHGVNFALTEESPGHYLTSSIPGLIGNTYTLYITTRSGRQLISDKVTLNDTPGIQNIYATYSPPVNGQDGGIRIFLDTEDPTKQAHFYRWEFIETWEIQTPFESEFVWQGGNNVVFRDIPVSTCYGSDTSNTVLIQSTIGLNDDKVTGQLIQTIPKNSPSLRTKYSILIRQFGLSEKAYLYWQTLQKINQSQGTLYDTQPGTVTGNINSINDNQTVLGYFDSGVVKEKRVFFSPKDFYASGYSPPDLESSCYFLAPTQVPSDQIGAFFAQPGNQNFEITGATGVGPSILFLVPKECCDCTALGSNVKPSFWP